MNRRLSVTDRLVVLVVGLALLALGLVGLDWHYDRVLDLPTTLDTGAVSDAVTSGWWPWAAAGGGVLLGLLGLGWLLAHLRRPGPASTRLEATDATGLLEADLRSVASACAERFATQAPVVGVRGSTQRIGSTTVVVLTGQVDPYADPDAVLTAAASCTADLVAAFPGEGLSCRVVLDAPRRSRMGRTTRVRVR